VRERPERLHRPRDSARIDPILERRAYRGNGVLQAGLTRDRHVVDRKELDALPDDEACAHADAPGRLCR
jgi:hypothetical protein